VPYGDSNRYFEEFERNVSVQARRFDLGLGLASLSASLLVLFATARIWTVERLKSLRTPRRRWQLVLVANLVWAYYVWASLQILVLQFRRDEFPPWADSIGIAYAGIAAFGLLGGALMNVGLLACLFRARLPVGLWIRPITMRSWALNACIAFAVIMCAWAGLDAVRIGDPYTPPAVVGAVSMLCIGRAAACAA
jgi:hypothetical protein